MKKKGFTLIELLAVIVILAIIALIITPIITSVIQNARESSNDRSADGYVDAAENFYAETIVDENQKTLLGTNVIDDLSINGTKATGTVIVTDNGKVAMAIIIGDKCYKKTADSQDITKTSTDDCTTGVVPPDSCFQYKDNGSGLTITKYLCGDSTESLEGEDGVMTYNNDGTYKYVIIPDTIAGKPVTEIGQSAFSEDMIVDSQYEIQHAHVGIYSITFSKNIVSIGDAAFSANRLTSVTIPDTLTSLGEFAFSANKIKNVTLGTGLTTLTEGAFYNNNLKTIDIPSNITSIGWSALAINNINNITIPTTVTSLGGAVLANNQMSDEDAFVYARNSDGSENKSVLDSYAGSNRNSVVIPSNVTEISHNALDWCGIKNITLPTNLSTIGNYAISRNNLTSITIPDSVTIIGDGAFSENSLTSVTIPNNVTSIGEYGFYKNNISTLSLGNNVESIGNYGFCKNSIATLTLDDNLTYLGEYAFYGNSMDSVNLNTNLVTISKGAFLFNDLTTITIPSKVTTVGAEAFLGNKLTKAVIGEGVTSIGAKAFAKAEGIATSDMTHFNLSLSSIINKTGKSFNWSDIVVSNTANQTFVTGTIAHRKGDITVAATE